MQSVIFGLEITSVQQWLGVLIAAASVIGIIGGIFRWVIKHYLSDIKHELQPNSGKSMKDQITRLESQQQSTIATTEETKVALESKIDDVQSDLEAKLDRYHEENARRIDAIYQLIIQKL